MLAKIRLVETTTHYTTYFEQARSKRPSDCLHLGLCRSCQCRNSPRDQRSAAANLLVSRVLQDLETRYQVLEKVVMSLITVVRRLRPYFQNHEVIVRTNCPIQKILQTVNMVN